MIGRLKRWICYWWGGHHLRPDPTTYDWPGGLIWRQCGRCGVLVPIVSEDRR